VKRAERKQVQYNIETDLQIIFRRLELEGFDDIEVERRLWSIKTQVAKLADE
jgi:hypothetical protein